MSRLIAQAAFVTMFLALTASGCVVSFLAGQYLARAIGL